ncbi:alpha/beta fold hydrolase [Myxosarcina sp. GI1(2024)]
MSVINEWNHQFISTDGVKLHYVSQGEGKLMLMLHGFPEFWYSWRHQITEFASDYRTVAPDLRGYNDSDKPQGVAAYSISKLIEDVRGVIRGLGYEECILIGHDWGGAIAWNFAYAYPELVEKLIVLNVPHPAKFAAGIQTPQQLLKSWYIFAFQLPWLPELVLQANDYQAIATMLQQMAVDKLAFSPEDLEAFKNAAAKRGALTAMINYYRCLGNQVLSGRRTSWGVLEIPTLMIWGEKDAALGKELTYGTEAYVRDLQIKYIPNCSHWVQQERPVLVNQYIREFLAGE